MQRIVLLLLLTAIGAGCSKVEPEIKGNWEIVSVLGDGREMASTGDRFEFKEDASMLARIAGEEQQGKWREEKEKTTLVVSGLDGQETRYDYRFRDDSLFLKTVVGKGHQLSIVGVREQSPSGHGH
jgi:hypothetical protein